MNQQAEALKKKLGELPEVPHAAILAYERKQDAMIQEIMEKAIGGQSEGIYGGFSPADIREIHQEHVKSMVTVFKLNYFTLLLHIIPWAYRVSRYRQVPDHYYIQMYKSWITAVDHHIEPHLAKPIKDVYQWLIDQHERFLEISKDAYFFPFEISESWQAIQERFLAALLKGDHKTCIHLSDESVYSKSDLEEFYLQVIKPSMYKIGISWEKGEISVAHEHLATSIISRVMANLYPRFILLDEPKKQKAVVTASPNEFHEIGARMVADLLEKDGWDVDYLGANVPKQDIIDLLMQKRPLILGISVAMPYNLDKALSLIHEIKSDQAICDTRILLGGKIFLEDPNIWEQTGADEFAINAREAVQKANKLLKGASKNGTL